MAKTPGPIASKLNEELTRYRGLRQHDEAQGEFREKLYRLQKWQADRMKKTHEQLLDDEKYRDATLFFLEDIYGGIDLSDLANEAERAMNKALKILPEKVMTTSAHALELNALSAELDELLALTLFYEMEKDDFSMEDYTQAFRMSAAKTLRDRQTLLARELAVGLDKYVRSRVIYATFKMVRRPAHKAGIGNLYNFMGKGFEVMRPMGSASLVIHAILEKEEEAIERIYQGEISPYGFVM